MLKKTALISLIMFFFINTISFALDFNPGQYEITSKVEMPGMPSPMPPQTMTHCLTEQDPVPNQDASNQDCNITDLVTKGNTISWKMECSQQGQKMESNGQMTYDGDSFEGIIKTKMGSQGGNMTITTIISGKRIGDCE